MTDLEGYIEPVATIDVGIGTNRRAVDLASLMGLAQRIARVNEFVPSAFRGRPEAILAALLTGAELGLGPMQSLRSIHVIEGRPALSAEVMRALVLANGHEIVVDDATDETCTVRGRRRDTDTWSNPVTWTMDRARRAKLAGRQNWTNYPRQMLLARATGELCRTYFADVVGGLEAVEWLEDETSTNSNSTKPRAARGRRTKTTELEEPPAPQPPLEIVNNETTTTKRPPRKHAGGPPPEEPEVSATSEPSEDEAGMESDAPPVSDSILDPKEKTRRKLHAEISETFPDVSPERKDHLRHALCVLVSRYRPEGPVTSSNDLDDGELALLSARLIEIRQGQLLIGVADDGTVELSAGPWRYYVHLEPPSVEVIDSRTLGDS